MQISIELSCYPLAITEFKTEIWAFIDKLKSVDGLRVVTNGMSTQVFGDYDLATTTVLHAMKQLHQQCETTVFVCKFIAGNRKLVEPKVN
jgi:uncharacterized protein YqgV (UPF0045/DUF77 family)